LAGAFLRTTKDPGDPPGSFRLLIWVAEDDGKKALLDAQAEGLAKFANAEAAGITLPGILGTMKADAEHPAPAAPALSPKH
jgi:hypothetical protein